MIFFDAVIFPIFEDFSSLQFMTPFIFLLKWKFCVPETYVILGKNNGKSRLYLSIFKAPF